MAPSLWMVLAQRGALGSWPVFCTPVTSLAVLKVTSHTSGMNIPTAMQVANDRHLLKTPNKWKNNQAHLSFASGRNH